MTPEQLERRNAAIRLAWDDPLRRALMRAMKEKPNSIRSSDEAYNAYHRAHRKTYDYNAWHRDYRKRKRDDIDRVP